MAGNSSVQMGFKLTQVRPMPHAPCPCPTPLVHARLQSFMSSVVYHGFVESEQAGRLDLAADGAHTVFSSKKQVKEIQRTHPLYCRGFKKASPLPPLPPRAIAARRRRRRQPRSDPAAGVLTGRGVAGVHPDGEY